MCRQRIKHKVWVALVTNESTEKKAFEQGLEVERLSPAVLWAFQAEETAHGSMKKDRKRLVSGCVRKQHERDFSGRLDGGRGITEDSGVWVYATHGDSEDITETGEGQGWNEFWGKDQWSVLGILDLSCPLGVPLKVLNIQPPVWEWEWGSGDTDLGASNTDGI